MNPLLDIKYALLPEAILAAVIIICTVLSFLLNKNNQKYIYYVAIAGSMLSAAGFATLQLSQDYSALWGSFVSDTYTIVFRGMILLGAIITLLLTKKYTSGFGSSKGEFYTLILIATLGAMLLTGASDLVMILVAIETLGISSFALSGYTKKDKLSNEAALKYLIIGAASTAVLLWGFSLIYGITGETNIFNISSYLVKYAVNPVLIISFLFIIGGFSYKVAAVPFHAWAPDVYQGSPIPVAAFLSVVSKIAGFAVLIRFISFTFTNMPILNLSLAVIAVLTMTIGNLIAVKQTNIKRLMAYSSIAQAGYLLAGIAVFTKLSLTSVIFYLITYIFMNFGTWAAIEIFATKTGKDNIDDYNGIAFKNPLFAAGLTLCLLSLAGIPITAGFFGKFFLFQAILFAGFKFSWLLIITLINTIIAVFYYLKVIRAMFLRPLSIEAKDSNVPKSLITVLGLTTAMVLLIGIFATPIINLSQSAADKINIPTVNTSK